MNYLNKSIIRVDARDKVTGKAQYPGDFHLENQLFMKVVFAERPHAIIRSIDTSEAEQLPGVVAVLTSADVPVNEYGLQIKDQPVLCGPGSTKEGADHVRFIGDQIACVVAESLSVAEEAAELIDVEWFDLPVITDPELSRSGKVMEIHPMTENNICWYDRVRKGDVEAAFEKADIIIENTYETPVQEHAYLQPEAGFAYMDDEERITIVISGQWTHEDQEQIAHALGLPEEKIRVIYPAIGGAFGGREDMSLQIVLALAVKKLSELRIDRPVKCVWSREDSIIGHGKRHHYKIHSKWGAMKDGKIIASETKILADAGAYMYTTNKVMGNAILVCNGPYEIPNVFIDAYGIYTNNVPGAAFRGFGGPQGAYAGEMQMNHLAEALNMDPVELRLKNVYHKGSLINVNTPIPDSIFMEEVLEDCALASGWVKNDNHWTKNRQAHIEKASEYIRSGTGLAVGFKNIGFSYGYGENCWATIELFGDKEIEKVILHHATAEVGQGTHTAVKQMTAEALGVDIGIIETDYSDTATSNSSGSVSASRMTFMAGNAVKQAAEIALHKWEMGERPVKVVHQYLAPQTSALDPETGYCMPNFTYAYVGQSVQLTVDMETGEIKIQKVIVSDDVGKAVNPQQVTGQIEGCTVQAQGYVISENFIQEGGYVKTNRLSTYLIPTVMDIPDEIESRILEYPDQYGPWGVKGVGELPYLALAPAIMAALYDAAGVWFHEFPLTPERVLRGLGKL